MTPSSASVRTRGVAGRATRHGGLASPAVVVLHGPDAAVFLHGQVTNDVSGLDVGRGNFSARVSRTGHLQMVFSTHRVAQHTFWLVCAEEDSADLFEQLEAFHFADDVQISVLDDGLGWALVQGPSVPDLLRARAVPRTAEFAVHDVPGGRIVERSLTGDPGVLLHGEAVWLDAWLVDAQHAGMLILDEGPLHKAIDVFRLEAGHVRRPTELCKKRLLPGTGLEQSAVSYTKGCYIGQEVISRVRTYGNVPWALRMLLLDEAALLALPAVGEPLVLEDGSKVGELCSRGWSEHLGKTVAMAWVKRDHRTPGARITLRGTTGLWPAEVALMPLYRAPDAAARVAQDYDLAIKAFAGGDTAAALTLLEGALRIDPTFADGYEVLGVILGRSGAFHEAIDFFKRLEEVAPAEPLVHTNLSLYYMKLGDTETAELHRALALQKSLQGGDATRSATEMAREVADAQRADARRKRAMFSQVLAFDPDDEIALLGVGRALSVLEQWPGAEEHLLRAVQANGRNSAAWLALGRAQEHLGKAEHAIETYAKGIEVASKRGDLQPLKQMQNRRLLLTGSAARSD